MVAVFERRHDSRIRCGKNFYIGLTRHIGTRYGYPHAQGVSGRDSIGLDGYAVAYFHGLRVGYLPARSRQYGRKIYIEYRILCAAAVIACISASYGFFVHSEHVRRSIAEKESVTVYNPVFEHAVLYPLLYLDKGAVAIVTFDVRYDLILCTAEIAAEFVQRILFMDKDISLCKIIAGIGIAICFRQGGSTGGTDIIAMIVNKYKTISYGRIVMTVDSMIILSSLFVGDMGVDSVIYGFVVTAVLGYTVDVIQAGNQQSSQIFVFTRRYEAMADQIIATTRHSATILDATGWYSKEDIKVVVVVCRKRETSQLLKLVRGVDGDAFISVGSVMGVYGKGFEALNKV